MRSVDEWRVYVITDRSLSMGRSNEEVIRRAIAGGADVVQFRAKEGSTADVYREALRLRRVTRATDTPFIINDRVDVALAVDAEGVHLGQDDLPLTVARRILGPNKMVGASTHSFEQALSAAREGAHYVSVGPVFPTRTKEAGPPVGIDLIRHIKGHVAVPVVAIGGIGSENVAQVLQAGADGVAVISAVVSAGDIEASVRALRDKFEGVDTDRKGQ